MLKRCGEQSLDMCIIQPVVHMSSVLSILYEFLTTKVPKLVRNGRLFKVELLTEVVNAPFLVQDCGQDAHSRGV